MSVEEAPCACVVVAMRTALRRRWRAAENAGRPLRRTLAQATRLITQITNGRGSQKTLDGLERLCPELALLDAEAADALSGSLARAHDEWLCHAVDGTCSAGVCFLPNVAPCRAACPADIDIPGFLAHIGAGDYGEALRLIGEDNPLPHSCGLVCPAPCESACVRGATGSALFIRPLKAVVAEQCCTVPSPRRSPSGKRVAVVGSGPSGLTIAYYLAMRGHRVEVFEAREKAGGMMRYGIPSYRLPAHVLDAEIAHITRAGVTIHTGAEIRSLGALREKGFEATYLALGLQLSRRAGILGEELPFVHGALDFLASVAAGKNPRVGPRVVVIGGGNSAVDAAMTALRQGARHVSMVYRGRRKEMRASPHEIALAVAEGVEILELWTPDRVLPDNRVIFTRSPKATEAERRGGEALTLKVDHVLAAVGQQAALDCLAGSRVEVKGGFIVADPVTGATAEPGVYAGGDIAHGASTVVAAVQAGKAAADAIHEYLTGETAAPQAEAVPAPLVEVDAIQRSVRLRPTMPERNARERTAGYHTIELGLGEADAKREASRCLRCDVCIGCGLCELVCSEVGAEALRMDEAAGGRMVFTDFTRPATSCIGCGACAAVCPTGAIKVESDTSTRTTSITGTVVCRQPMLTCESCGEYYVTAAQFDRVRDTLPNGENMRHLCPDCSRREHVAALQRADEGRLLALMGR
ncbi:Glutamate synthase [NADPH] small chain [Rhodovulum sp. PH10]|uniref:FAD-dependent oxidoreductase n=1 Tax=Rhodovulum sp. PH10 TaxID=1187851 RepID=UPI00027C2BB0|nr:FAD-dependent oxidoreductase [Rhodovulum sp. PH10]EJW10574.1 Glutamate synthase [NADPH] small chain [Rhodovulum sp. PH10]